MFPPKEQTRRIHRPGWQPSPEFHCPVRRRAGERGRGEEWHQADFFFFFFFFVVVLFFRADLIPLFCIRSGRSRIIFPNSPFLLLLLLILCL
jgi:hypothetical protein